MNLRSCPSLKIDKQGSRKLKMTLRDLRFIICQSLEIDTCEIIKILSK
jgi:hypothetical protein